MSALYLLRNIPGTHFCQRLSRPQGHSAAGMNRTRDLPACSAVPQSTARHRVRKTEHANLKGVLYSTVPPPSYTQVFQIRCTLLINLDSTHAMAKNEVGITAVCFFPFRAQVFNPHSVCRRFSCQTLYWLLILSHDLPL